MNATLRNLIDDTTPFASIDIIGVGFIRLYWTKTAGTYGHQVHYIAVNSREDGNTKRHTGKTNGYGFCKNCDATEQAYKALGVMPKDYKPGSEETPYAYFIGGNEN